MARIVNPEELKRYLASMTAIEDTINLIQTEDVADLGARTVEFIKDRFPKAHGSRNTLFRKGAHSPVSRGTPLFQGWRTYMTGGAGEKGFVIRHSRASDPRIQAILASLDQGSKAYRIMLDRGKAFRFMAGGEKVIADATGGIKIPRRRPLPDDLGYIKPTQAYIYEQIEFLKMVRMGEIEDFFAGRKRKVFKIRKKYTF